jgi:hypothetical protein
VIAELATQRGVPHITGRTRMPWAARSPMTLSASDHFQVPALGSMRCHFIVQRTVFAPLAFRKSTSPPVMSLKAKLSPKKPGGVAARADTAGTMRIAAASAATASAITLRARGAIPG